MWCLVYPSGSCPYIILQVCICFVCVRLARTLLMEYQCTISNNSSVHSYFLCSRIGPVCLAAYNVSLYFDVVHVSPIRSIAFELVYGRESTGSTGMLPPSSFACVFSYVSVSHDILIIASSLYLCPFPFSSSISDSWEDVCELPSPTLEVVFFGICSSWCPYTCLQSNLNLTIFLSLCIAKTRSTSALIISAGWFGVSLVSMTLLLLAYHLLTSCGVSPSALIYFSDLNMPPNSSWYDPTELISDTRKHVDTNSSVEFATIHAAAAVCWRRWTNPSLPTIIFRGSLY